MLKYFMFLKGRFVVFFYEAVSAFFDFFFFSFSREKATKTQSTQISEGIEELHVCATFKSKFGFFNAEVL